jgi:hypothetical protein
MRLLLPASAIVLVSLWPFTFSTLHATRAIDDDPPDPALERLRAEERAREESRAEAEAREEAEHERREREREEKEERAALAKRDAATAFARRRAAMHDWHRRTFENLAPVLTARGHLYRRLPHRRFAAVRPACAAFRAAIEEASPGYLKAPDRRVDLLMTDLLAIYRESARWCTEGGYFSFTAQEMEVRRVVTELIDALAPYDLGFPAPATVGSGLVRSGPLE